VVDDAEALRIGAIDEIVPARDIRTRAIALAGELAQNGAAAALREARSYAGFDIRKALDECFEIWRTAATTPAALERIGKLLAKQRGS
jgi:enoyl-CoA hydratase/carnithine racemase